jgi:hypothetical protein
MFTPVNAQPIQPGQRIFLWGQSAELKNSPTPELTRINSIPQFTRTMKCNDLPRCQHQIFARSWISAPSFLLLLYTKFSKPGDQNILTGFQFAFDDL